MYFVDEHNLKRIASETALADDGGVDGRKRRRVEEVSQSLLLAFPLRKCIQGCAYAASVLRVASWRARGTARNWPDLVLAFRTRFYSKSNRCGVQCLASFFLQCFWEPVSVRSRFEAEPERRSFFAFGADSLVSIAEPRGTGFQIVSFVELVRQASILLRVTRTQCRVRTSRTRTFSNMLLATLDLQLEMSKTDA